MKLNQINNNISFTRAIDTHTHRGHWWAPVSKDVPNAIKAGDGSYYILKDLTCDVFEVANGSLSGEENRVEKCITSNLDCMIKKDTPFVGTFSPFLKNETEGNLELLKNSSNKNEYFYATGQPGYGSAQSLKEVIEIAPERFVGIKLHPEQLSIPANDSVYEPYMKLASEKKLPVLFHSQVSANWLKDINGNDIVELTKEQGVSDPRRIYSLAKKYPDVPVIMGHTGAGAGEKGHQIALDTMLESVRKKDANLYCDISWVDFKNDLPVENPKSLLGLIKELKKENALDRILFGSDVPVGIFGEKQARGLTDLDPSMVYDDMQNKIKNAIRNDDELKNDADEIIDRIFYKNADELFFKTKNQLKTNSKSKGKTGLIAFGALAGIALLSGALIYYNKKIKQKSKN